MADDLLSILQDAARRARLPAGMRNNNPGNIKYVGQKIPGIVGPSVNTDQGDPQAVFDSPESGMGAMYRLLSKKYAGGKRSANDMIAGNMGWTPGNYEAAANVARYAGVDPNADIGLSDPKRAATFMRALMRQEHGNASSLYTDDMISRAIAGTGAAVPGTMATNVAAATPASTPVVKVSEASGYVAPDKPVQVPEAVTRLAQGTSEKKGIADVFSLLALQQAQPEQAPAPVPIMGPSAEQATALTSFLQSLMQRRA